MPNAKEILQTYRKNKGLDNPSSQELASLLVRGTIHPLVNEFKDKMEKLQEEYMLKMANLENDVLGRLERVNSALNEQIDTNKNNIESRVDSNDIAINDKVDSIANELKSEIEEYENYVKEEHVDIRNQIVSVDKKVRKDFSKDLNGVEKDLKGMIKNIELIPGKDGKDGKDGTELKAEEMAKKLNTLEEKVDVKVIRGLKSLLANLQRNIRDAKGGGGVGTPVSQTFAGNGADTQFTLTNNVQGNGKCIWAYYNGQWLVPTTHFSVSGKTFTTTFTPESDTNIDVLYFRT